LLWENEDLDDIEWLIDSISDENSTQEYLEWTMDQDTGSVHIFIVTNYNGCRDTVKLFDRFYIDGPIIDDIQQDYECSNPFDYTFTLNITEGDYWNWYFDDGSPSILNSTNESINHSFPGTGEYWLTVIAYNTETGCEYLDSLRIEIYQPEAIFYANNNNVCVNDPIIFSGDNSTDAVSYYWDFGDGEILDWSDNAFPQHAYSSSGDFVVTLTIEDSNGCQASTTQNVHVVGPGIEIIALPDTHGCNELEVDFSYIVDFDPSYNIIYKLWSLSNGVTNTQETFSYTFLPGSYDVSLTIAISNGVSTCYNTLTLPDYITVTSLETEVHTFEYNNTGCTGEVMQFYAGIEDPMLNYSWDFGDGNTSTEINPTHVFTSGGDFNVVLTLDDGLGCSNTGNVEVEIQEINADFTLAQNTFSCYPAFLDITNLVDPDEYNPSFEWVMENLTTGAIDTLPLYVPEDYYFNAPGTYQITLNVFTIHGCFGTHSETVTVNGPSAEWHIDPDTVCAGDTVHFSVFNLNNVENFTWYILGESITNQEEFDYVFEEATPTGFTEIQLSIVSGLCNPIFEIRVYVQDVFADMNVLDTTSWLPSTSGCSPFITNLLNTSIGADSINWQIGNQYIENIDSLIVSFTNSGGISDSVYVVSLFAENELGCKDTLNQEITVYASPQIQITSDTIICLGDNLGLFATGGSTYEWTPNSFIEGENTNTPIINPEDNTTYTVHVINSNNCEAYDSVYIMVQQMPEISVSPDSATIIIGDSVNVDVITNQDNMTFTWIPQEEISCFHCPLPVMSPKQDTRYQLTVTDSIGCFSYTFNVDIFVIVEYTLDVPSAFTPLGHETNRIVYARGFGIKNLIEFRIYNRWGEEVFYTDDLEQGWDGYYNGKLQNIDTYKYYVKAEMWDGTIKTIKGDILLMR
jgi:gliding motility-associated-like protein